MFNAMQETEKFIEAVEKYPCLWNTNLPIFKCKNTRVEAWKQIVEETNMPSVEVAKDKWKKLKDAYREALRKRIKYPNRVYHKPYKFHHVMEFLLPVLNSPADDTGDDQQIITDEDEDPSLCSEDVSGLYSYADYEHDLIPLAQLQRERKKKSSEVCEVEEKKKRYNTKVSLDAMDRFFLSMSEGTKKLPEYLQLQVKRQVFNAVIDAEEAKIKAFQNVMTQTSTIEEGEVLPDAGSLELQNVKTECFEAD